MTEVDLLPRDVFEMSLLETETALRIADSGTDHAKLSLLEDSWNIEASNIPYVRPDRRRFSFCDDCEFQIGVGGTYHSFEGTEGVVIPVTVTWDRSRWELGVFHFSEQTSSNNFENVEQVVARPYWGASLSRRFAFYERGPIRAIFGFGVSYRTEQDVLSATHWNFSSQLGLRFQSPQFPAIIELSARHWSNGGVRTPNRGQDFTILTVRFDR
ncbi:MAG TPA: acyloxyacyl hydrolase [Steroidobacteraceae bacterium]